MTCQCEQVDQLRRIADALEGRSLRLVPVIGAISDRESPPQPTPTYRRKPKGDLIAMIQLTDSQQVSLSISIKDKRGNDAKIDGAPQWSVDDPNILALSVSDDGMTATVSAVGALGNGVVSVSADADPGDGTKTLSGSELITVTAGEATVITIAGGEPSEQATS